MSGGPQGSRPQRTSPDPLAIAVDVLAAHRAGDGRPQDLLAARFRAAGPLDGPVRARVARAVYRAIQQQRRAALACGAGRLAPELRAPALLITTLLLDAELDAADAAARMQRFGRAVIDWRRAAMVDERIARIADPVARFGARHSMPDWLAARLLDELGDAADAFAAASNAPAPRTIRANLLRVADRDALAATLHTAGVETRPTRFAPHGLIVAGTRPLFELDAFRAGLFEQQDEASQLCALVVAPPPRGVVLDACAGGGGKALALAAELGNRGEILAVDVHARRLAELTPRRRRAGVDVIRSLPTEEHAWPDAVVAFARRADRILIDAPCSGVGSWRRRPDARWSLTPEACASLRGIQAALLDRALAAARPGARVVYATCTVFRDENEAQVEAALARHPGLELVRVAEILGTERAAPLTDPTGTFLQLRPDLHGTDGFFAAILRRKR